MRKLWWIGIFLAGLGLGCLFSGGSMEIGQERELQTGVAVRQTGFVCRELMTLQGTEPVAVLLLENTGNTDYRDTCIVVVQNGKRLYFETELLSAGGVSLIMERDGKTASGTAIDDCYCMSAIPARE